MGVSHRDGVSEDRGISQYRRVLALRDVRRVLLLSIVVRVPLWASNVVLTLHVVTHLDRSYSAAGVLASLATVAIAVSGPWRGRILDRAGLRRTLVPSLVMLTICWSIAPFVGYLPLLLLAVLGGLFEIPSFSVVRQSLIATVPEAQRKTALSIDSVAVEISFMIGPVLGVLLATFAPTSWALLGCELASVLGGALLWLVNPPLRSESALAGGRPTPPALREWLGLEVVAVLVASAAATLVLGGSDVSIVAALRHLGHQSWIGWVLAVWGLGSAAGGLVYGALHRSVPLVVLLAALSAATVPVVLAPEPFTLAALLLVAGFCCAPTITAGVDTLSRLVPESARGEAMGWHAAAMTTGVALGAPVAGVAIDSFGWRGGFVVSGVAGLALAGVTALLLRHPLAGPAASGAAAEVGPAGPPRATVEV